MSIQDFLREALVLVLFISGIPLALCALAGIAVSFLQTVLQIQDQSLSYGLKIGVIILCAVYGGAHCLELIEDHFIHACVVATEIGMVPR